MIKPVPLTPATRQRALAKSLYRKLFRECQRIPPHTSLVHLDQWVGDSLIKDRETLRTCLQTSFRCDNLPNQTNNEGIQRALEGLKYLLNLNSTTRLLDPKKEKATTSSSTIAETPSEQLRENFYSLKSPICSESLLESVDWLPSVSEMEETTEQESMELPVFPLSGPLFPDENGQRLPLLSRFSDTPVYGMEVPLRIFEPRYRKLYQDLLSSPDSPRRFVVPFAHPYQPGTFASYGWIYEIVKVKDVADQSNGQFQLVCNHVVTQPIKIAGIANPEDYETQSTYLRCFANNNDDLPSNNQCDAEKEGEEEKNPGARSLGDEPTPSSDDLRPLEDLLHQLKNKALSLSSDNANRPIDQSLIDRLLMASGEGSIWPVAQVWVLNLQTEILRLQMKVSTRIQVQAKLAQQMSVSTGSSDEVGDENRHKNAEWQEFVTDEIVSLAQEPYESHLRCMLIEVSTLIPWLLQEDSHKAQCDRMCERIRERLLVSETEEQP